MFKRLVPMVLRLLIVLPIREEVMHDALAMRSQGRVIFIMLI